jgi:DNA polymerase-3 subunit delta'
MSEASPHPREVFAYEGGEAAETEWLRALDRGRMHHAWLLTGPEGVGKATFAYRAARRLLGGRPDLAYGLLGVSPDDPVSRQVAARSHPDLLVLERGGEDGKARKYISVDEARRLPEFFSKAPASAPFRVAIVDAADDMNINAANALLKTLEEPPARGVLFLISHRPGALIATIRSRCRRLAFPAWAEDRIDAFLERSSNLDAEARRRVAAMAQGAPGRALILAEAGALEADGRAREILGRLPGADESLLMATADGFRGAEGQARFELLFERLADQVRQMTLGAAEQGDLGGDVDRWAEVWEQLSALPAEAEALNLDRADAFFTVMGRLKAAARA